VKYNNETVLREAFRLTVHCLLHDSEAPVKVKNILYKLIFKKISSPMPAILEIFFPHLKYKKALDYFFNLSNIYISVEILLHVPFYIFH